MTNLLVKQEHCLIAPKENIDFFHEYAVAVEAGIEPYELYAAMTTNIPWLLRIAFPIRDILSSPAGVRKISGFNGERPKVRPMPGDTLDFFKVETCCDDMMCLTSRDRHLSVMVSMSLTPRDFQNPVLTVTTSVEIHNGFGRIYMFPVSLVHHSIVRSMCEKVRTVYI